MTTLPFSAIIVLISAVAWTIACVFVGYIFGKRFGSKKTERMKFAVKFTALQVVATTLFVAYNKFLTDDPQQLINLGILALIGGETVGMLVSQGVDKAVEKAMKK